MQHSGPYHSDGEAGRGTWSDDDSLDDEVSDGEIRISRAQFGLLADLKDQHDELLERAKSFDERCPYVHPTIPEPHPVVPRPALVRSHTVAHLQGS